MRLAEYLRSFLRDRLGMGPEDRLVVAFSGGVDSLVLLHLLRFRFPPWEGRLLAAHFDHAMRPESGEEALWVRGLCRAWGVPLRTERAPTPPGSEEEAREARYAFLFRVLEEEDARWIVTAHHADDQAETVLFRILRGTGIGGLAGMAAVRAPGLVRPLLPFTRAEILRYARSAGLRPRQDPTNLDLQRPRNFLRHRTLPELEAGPAPRARRALVRLAHLARENEEAWASLLPGLLEGVLETSEEGDSIVRSALLSYHPGVRARLLRAVLRRSGIRLDEAGTRAAVEFTTGGASGRALELGGGWRLTRSFDRFYVRRSEGEGPNRPLVIPGPAEGTGGLVVGGRRFRVRWGVGSRPSGDLTFEAPSEVLAFPLTLRGRMPGDRMALPYGTKKLKRLLAESRVPLPDRDRIPVLVDAEGRVLWVAGVRASVLAGRTGAGSVAGRQPDETRCEDGSAEAGARLAPRGRSPKKTPNFFIGISDVDQN